MAFSLSPGDAVPSRNADIVREMYEAFNRWDAPGLEPQRIEVLGADVLVQVRVSGTGRSSGIPLFTEYFHAWRFRDGRPQCCVVRSDGAEALEVLQNMPLRRGDDTEHQGPAAAGLGD